MARTGITKQQVVKAIEELKRRNHPITVSAIRDELGTGSYSTISTYLSAWKEASEQQKIADYPEIPEQIRRSFDDMWRAAWEAAQESVQAEREALTTARTLIEREKEEMAAEIARLESEISDQTAERHKLTETLALKTEAMHKLEKTKNDLELQNARLDERNKSSEQRAHDLKEELEKLHARFQEVTNVSKRPSSKNTPDAKE